MQSISHEPNATLKDLSAAVDESYRVFVEELGGNFPARAHQQRIDLGDVDTLGIHMRNSAWENAVKMIRAGYRGLTSEGMVIRFQHFFKPETVALAKSRMRDLERMAKPPAS